MPSPPDSGDDRLPESPTYFTKRWDADAEAHSWDTSGEAIEHVRDRERRGFVFEGHLIGVVGTGAQFSELQSPSARIAELEAENAALKKRHELLELMYILELMQQVGMYQVPTEICEKLLRSLEGRAQEAEETLRQIIGDFGWEIPETEDPYPRFGGEE